MVPRSASGILHRTDDNGTVGVVEDEVTGTAQYRPPDHAHPAGPRHHELWLLLGDEVRDGVLRSHPNLLHANLHLYLQKKGTDPLLFNCVYKKFIIISFFTKGYSFLLIILTVIFIIGTLRI